MKILLNAYKLTGLYIFIQSNQYLSLYIFIQANLHLRYNRQVKVTYIYIFFFLNVFYLCLALSTLNNICNIYIPWSRELILFQVPGST